MGAIKTYTVTDQLTEEVFKVDLAASLTPKEVEAAVQVEIAKRRAEAAKPTEVLVPADPPPPPWRIAGQDPLEKQVRCTHCGGYKAYKEIGKHLIECDAVPR